MAGTKVQPSLDVRRIRGTSAVVTTGTAYGALDFVGGVYTFANVIPPKRQGNARSCEVRSSRLLDLQDAAPPTGGWTLGLFRQLPTVISTDTNTLDIGDVSADFLLDFINFPATASTHVFDLGSSQAYKCSMPNGPISIVLDDVDFDGVPTEDLSIYGVLQVLGTWTTVATTAPVIDLMVVAD